VHRFARELQLDTSSLANGKRWMFDNRHQISPGLE
jgi:hypothetical protein